MSNINRALSKNYPGILELVEEAKVVLVEKADIVEAVANHGYALQAHTESITTPNRSIVIHRAENLRIDHSCAGDFEPPGSLANPAAFSAANTREIVFHARFGKREEMWSESNFSFRPQQFPGESGQNTFQVRHGDIAINI